MTKEPVPIVHVVACQPPATVRTREQWDAWRKEEDERIFGEVQAQLKAWLEVRNVDPEGDVEVVSQKLVLSPRDERRLGCTGTELLAGVLLGPLLDAVPVARIESFALCED